jgi:hypothetical protein
MGPIKTRAELARELAIIERVLADVVVVTRTLIHPDGRKGERIVRGYFRRPCGTEPQEERKSK